ncbi:MAG TPA: PilN domain-containing protein, partial [Candidatus Udaeobacter sp.]|nr:PilN domain-containing protein [Candidatus Udaeobacter sp.]
MTVTQPMIRINLLPTTEQVVTRSSPAPSLPALAPAFVVAAAVSLILVISTLQTFRLRHLHSELKARQAEAQKLAPFIRRIDQLTQERELTLKRLAVIEDLDRDRLTRVRVVDELARRMPEYMWLTGFSEKTGAINITGITFSNLTVAELITSLERSVLFEQVDLTVAER